MTQIEQTQHAKVYAGYWQDKGDEKQETQRYWIELLQEVLGVENPSRYIEFEKTVKIKHTNFIDAYISSTKVLIEQKGAKVDLTKPQEQSDGAMLTPYQQAKRYADELSYDLKPRWIVVSNFKEVHVHDMNNPHEEPEIIKLENLEKEYYRLQFLQVLSKSACSQIRFCVAKSNPRGNFYLLKYSRSSSNTHYFFYIYAS